MPNNSETQFGRKLAYDVMVIGGGAAGGAAAIAAAESGGRVCLVEAAPKIGGSTALSGGFVRAADTDLQKENGIEDFVDAFYDDVMEVNRGSVDPVIIRSMCENARHTVDWLKSIGVTFFYDPQVPRGHGTVGGGAQLMLQIEARLADKGVDVACNTRVTRLLTNETGAVCGAEIDGEEVFVGAVILTTGGYGANPQMIEEFMPRAKLAGDWLHYVGGACNRGDGIGMARTLNAAVEGTDYAMLGVGNGFHRHTEVFVPSWTMVVNEKGERFGKEYASYWDHPEMFRRQPNHHGFAIIDGEMLDHAEPDRRVAEYYRQGALPVSWLPDEFREKISEGMVQTADTLAALADKVGIDPDALEASVARYNRFCETGVDEDFGKEAIDLVPVLKPPFAAVEIRNHVLWLTQGGLLVDPSGRVLREGGQGPIDGLYAAGEVVTNINGAVYSGTGFSISSSLTMGRIAGAAAAAHAATLQEA